MNVFVVGDQPPPSYVVNVASTRDHIANRECESRLQRCTAAIDVPVLTCAEIGDIRRITRQQRNQVSAQSPGHGNQCPSRIEDHSQYAMASPLINPAPTGYQAVDPTDDRGHQSHCWMYRRTHRPCQSSADQTKADGFKNANWQPCGHPCCGWLARLHGDVHDQMVIAFQPVRFNASTADTVRPVSPSDDQRPTQVDVLDSIGPADAARRLLVLYTGGTIGMIADSSGALVPLDLRELPKYLPILDRISVRLTMATFATPIDSAAAKPADWLAIADALVSHMPGHDGAVVLHGTDTMAYTASALSFLLGGIEVPIVLTGAQRSITEVRSDGRENLVTAAVIAGMQTGGVADVPEVAIFFDDVLLRGNRSTKVHADNYSGFDSPNIAPLGRAGVAIELDHSSIRAATKGPLRRVAGLCTDVASIRLHPALDAYTLNAILDRPGLRGVIVESYGSGNGPSDPWFVDAIHAATERDVVVVLTTQCRAGSVVAGHYATGAALIRAGAIGGADLTFEAALTKLMVALHGNDSSLARQIMQSDIAGEITIREAVTE